jgi:hypothetical protein
MFNLSSGIDSLARFKRQTTEFLKTLHDTGEPLVLMVNGKAEVVVQDAAAYLRLVDLAMQTEREPRWRPSAKGWPTWRRAAPNRRGRRSPISPENTT